MHSEVAILLRLFYLAEVIRLCSASQRLSYGPHDASDDLQD